MLGGPASFSGLQVNAACQSLGPTSLYPTQSSSTPFISTGPHKASTWTRRELALGVLALGNALVALLAIGCRLEFTQSAHETLDAAKFVVSQARSSAPFDVTGRTVVVTGSSKGIGKGIASVFAKAGANVLVNSRHLAEAQQTADEIVAAGGVASAFAADVTVEADMLQLAKVAAERYGGIDVMVANAGAFPDKLLENMELADWSAVLDLNLRGTFLATKAALPYIKQSSVGRIILTSSITGPITGYPGWTHYGAAKAGQLGFMRSAAVELAKYNITVNAISPGNVLVDSLAEMGPAYLKKTEAVIPLGRFGTVEEMGYACLFLASKEAGFITGQTIVLDGGQTPVENPSFKEKW